MTIQEEFIPVEYLGDEEEPFVPVEYLGPVNPPMAEPQATPEIEPQAGLSWGDTVPTPQFDPSSAQLVSPPPGKPVGIPQSPGIPVATQQKMESLPFGNRINQPRQRVPEPSSLQKLGLSISKNIENIQKGDAEDKGDYTRIIEANNQYQEGVSSAESSLKRGNLTFKPKPFFDYLPEDLQKKLGALPIPRTAEDAANRLSAVGEERYYQQFGAPRKSFLDAAKHGYSQAGNQFVGGKAGNIEMVGEIVGADGMAEWGKEVANRVEKYQQDHPEEEMVGINPSLGFLGTTKQLLARPENIIQGTLQTVPVVLEAILGHYMGVGAAGVIGKGAKALPYIGRVAGIAQGVTGDTYHKARKDGTDKWSSLAQSLLTGLGEGVVEEFTLGQRFKALKLFSGAGGKKVKGGIVKTFVKESLKAYGQGAVEEGVQGINSRFWNKVFTDPKTAVFDGVGQEAAMGGMLEMTMGMGTMAGAKAIANTPFGKKQTMLRNLEATRKLFEKADNLTDKDRSEIKDTFDQMEKDIKETGQVKEQGDDTQVEQRLSVLGTPQTATEATEELSSRLQSDVGPDAPKPTVTIAKTISKANRAVASLAKKVFGVDVLFVDTNKAGDTFNGYHTAKNGTIVINTNMDNPAMAVLGHEFMSHSLETQHPDLYKELSGVIGQNSRYTQWAEANKNRTEGMSEENIIREFVGDTGGVIFGEESFWKGIVETNPTMYRRLIQWLQGIYTKMGAIPKSYDTKPFIDNFDSIMQTAIKVGKEYQARQGTDQAQGYDPTTGFQSKDAERPATELSGVTPTQTQGKPVDAGVVYNGGGNLESKTGIHFTPDKELAQSFAKGTSAFREDVLGKFDKNKQSNKLTEATLDIQNTKEIAYEGQEVTPADIANYQKQGYDSVTVYQNGEVREYIVFDKSQITPTQEGGVTEPLATDVATTPLAQEALKYPDAESFVTGQGKPLYHGTGAEFEKFDITKTGTLRASDWGTVGIYFDPSKSGAKVYRDDAVGQLDLKAKKLYEKLDEIDKSLKPTGPFDSTPKYTKEWFDTRDEWMEALDQARKDNSKGKVIEAYLDPNAKIFKHYYEPGMLTDQFLSDSALKKGFDAVEIWNRDPTINDEYLSEIIVMNPSVIKTKTQLKAIYNKAHQAPTGVEGAFQRKFTLKSEEVIKDNQKYAPSAVAGLLNKGGVKLEESQILSEFLEDNKGRKSIPGSELIAHLKANVPEVVEHVKSDNANEEAIDTFLADEAGQGMDRAEAAEYLGRDEGAPKFKGYMNLPGGENYREILFTTKTETVDAPSYSEWMIAQGIDPATEDRARYATQYQREYPPRDQQGSFRTSGGHAYGDEAVINQFDRAIVDDRNIDSKRYLNILELQSDWSQKGRKNGYASDISSDSDFQEFKRLYDQGGNMQSLTGKNDSRYDELWDKLYAKYNIEDDVAVHDFLDQNIGVPQMPFKHPHEYALKALVARAIEEGYDGISWNGGETVADRYDLSKHIDRIIYSKNSDGSTYIDAEKDGESVDAMVCSKRELPNFIGKEAANKIFTSKNETGELSGLDLKVGGEWATALYDKMIPNYLKKQYKKYGAKVGSGEIAKESGIGEDITPTLLARAAAMADNQKDYVSAKFLGEQVKRLEDTGDYDYSVHNPNNPASQYVDEIRKYQDTTTTLHTLPFTEQMKKEISEKGQSKFQKKTPTGIPQSETAPKLGKLKNKIFSWMLTWGVEPTKQVEWLHGRGVPAKIISTALGGRAAEKHEFDIHQSQVLDKMFMEIEEMYDRKYTDNEKLAILMSRESPTSDAGKATRKEYMDKYFPKGADASVIKEISDYVHKRGQEILGETIPYRDDYWLGQFTNRKLTQSILLQIKSDNTGAYKKFKTIPTVSDAVSLGLKLKYTNPVRMMRAEMVAISEDATLKGLREYLLSEGLAHKQEEKGWVKSLDQAKGWVDLKSTSPYLKDLVVQQEVARLISNLVGKNALRSNALGKTLSGAAYFLQAIKFVGSMFHQISEMKQVMVDSGIAGNQIIRHPGMSTKKIFGTMTKRSLKGMMQEDLFRNKFVPNLGASERSIEQESLASMNNMINKLTGKDASKLLKGVKTGLGYTPPGLLFKYVNWMFETYIPAVKYQSFKIHYADKSARVGRELTDAECQEIIKETQNFYGEMDEKLFGRSGTATSLMRLMFMAPGFGEGNFRTVAKALLQHSDRGGKSKINIVQGLLVDLILATIGTFLLTGEWPEEPEDINDFTDLWSIKTPFKDRKGNALVISTLMFTKDYMGLLLRPTIHATWGSPGKNVAERAVVGAGDAAGYAYRRVGHMTSAFSKIASDLWRVKDGKVILDHFDNKIYYPHDPLQEKLLATLAHWGETVTPISVTKGVQSYAQIDWGGEGSALSYLAPLAISVLGAQVSKTARDKQLSAMQRTVWDMGSEGKEVRDQLLATRNPIDKINDYNDTIKGAISDLNDIKPGFDSKALQDKLKSMIIYPKEYQAEQLYKVASGKNKTKEQVFGAFKVVEHLGNADPNFKADTFERLDGLLKAYTQTPDPFSKTKKKNRYTYSTYIKHRNILWARYKDYKGIR